jgi:LacI family transcriptional regulator
LSATIYDIAKKARVGIGTVSRVLNNHANVSAATRKRVLDAVASLEYNPHPYAIGLARRKTNLVLFAVPFFATFFFLEILRGLQKHLLKHNINIILLGVNHPEQIEETLLDNIRRHRVDGVLLCSMKVPEHMAQSALLKKTPLVLVDTHHKAFDSFSINNKRGAFLATQHLLQQGHKRIGILNANLRSVPAKERLQGYTQALKAAGMVPDEQLIRTTRSLYLDGFTRETGYEMMKELLALRRGRPTAVFASSDIQAIGALAAIADAGLRTPDDIALIGFDDIELSGLLGLTSMRQPMSEMGSLAMQRLLRRIEHKKMEADQKMFEPTLIVRRSTNPHAPTAAQIPHESDGSDHAVVMDERVMEGGCL